MANSLPKKKCRLFTIVFSNVIKYLNDPSSRETKKNITSPLSAARTAHQYKNALLLDKNKNVGIAPRNDDIDSTGIHSDFIDEAVLKNKVLFSDFYRDERPDGLHLALIIPVMLIQIKKLLHVGTIMKIIDPERRLYPASKLWPLPGPTGEALLVSAAGAIRSCGQICKGHQVYYKLLDHIKRQC